MVTVLLWIESERGGGRGKKKSPLAAHAVQIFMASFITERLRLLI